jgi:hypothetical protein
MQQYNIYKHPAGMTEAVKLGWSWPAFFFPLIWALIKKLWGIVWSILGISVFLAIVIGDPAAIFGLNMIISVVASVILGMKGNSWREKNLTTRGFEKADTVSAATPEGAVALHLKVGSSTAP